MVQWVIAYLTGPTILAEVNLLFNNPSGAGESPLKLSEPLYHKIDMKE